MVRCRSHSVDTVFELLTLTFQPTSMYRLSEEVDFDGIVDLDEETSKSGKTASPPVEEQKSEPDVQ